MKWNGDWDDQVVHAMQHAMITGSQIVLHAPRLSAFDAATPSTLQGAVIVDFQVVVF